MRSKKMKPRKMGGKRRKCSLNVPSDVMPSTSLPPLVEGQLRCFLRVTVSRVLWTVSKPSSAVIIQLRWWGETSGGTVFLPQCGSGSEQAPVRTTTRYAIRCGPKQFTSYLTDMGTLVLEAHTKQDHFPIGRVQIAGIAQLSMSCSINGYFTLVSPTSEKLGEVQVSLALEPLTDSYDSSSSIPTTDMSAAMPELRSTSKPASHSDHMLVPSSSVYHSASDGKVSKGGSWPNTPRGKDHVYFHANGNSEKNATSAEIKEQDMKKPKPLSTRSLCEEEWLSHAAVQGSNSSPHRLDTNYQNSKDILSVLLDRGSKLRNAMVASALKSNLDSDIPLRDVPVPVPKDNVTAVTALPSMPSGKLLQDLLHSEPSLIYPQQSQQISEDPNHIWTPHAEDKAIELLLGRPDGLVLPFWDGEVSPPEFPSGASSVCGDSDLGDPHYDQSLLENLFYRAPMMDTSSSDFESEEENMFLGKKQQKKGSSGRADLVDHPTMSPVKKSVGLVHEGSEQTSKGAAVPSLSLDRITMLGQVQVARVLVHSLNTPPQLEVANKISTKGKPPYPLPNIKCTYFVEYLFPVASAKHNGGPVTMTTELTRLASSTTAEGVVKFQHQRVFPVQFNSTTIKHWWNTDLTFKIYSRRGSQKKPMPVGKAILPLHSLLQSEHLHESKALPVLVLEEGVKVGQRSLNMGPLKVSLELDVGKRGFSQTDGSKAPSQPPNQSPSSPHVKSALLLDNVCTQVQGPDLGKSNASTGFVEKQRRDLPPVQDKLCHVPHSTLPINNGSQHLEGENSLLLHALLMIPDGKDFSCGTHSVYLMCKLFETESTRSTVSWGQTNPTFNFIQVAPLAMTSRLLERMKNNMMIIEVWQKRGSTGQDQLLGLVKMPLHQFYMSYRDPKIAQLLLRAQYPVVGVDSYMPVVDVSSGSSHGCLRVLLAMGLAEQITFLQRMRGDDLISMSQPLRPFHLLDPPSEPKVELGHSEGLTEHVFEIRVERVKGLMPLQSTVWGEADCYIQYSFPARDRAATNSPEKAMEDVGLRQFRTATTLCIPDPVFSHDETHTLLTPVAIPVQRLLLHSFSGQNTDTKAGIHFEVWCRYYYPNVRDQLVAKGLLPLSKLCAMVTMQSEGQTGPQVFSLPLIPRSESSAGCQPQPSGLIDVCVRYKHRPFRTEDMRGGPVTLQVVMLAVQIHRAAGLQATVRAMMRNDERFQYYSDIGANSYVAVELSFLPENEKRSTQVIARSFCPEFQHHMEFPCSLLTQKVYGETCSLAELLDGATAVFTVYHRDSRRVNHLVPKDTVLGTVKVQLKDLIHKRRGISGWFPLSWPQGSEMPHAHHSPAGGLELSINFAHDVDRERVINSARNLGWEVNEDEQEGEEGPWSNRGRIVSMAVSVPRLWIPLHCLQLPGQKDLERSTYCYIRYKLYNRDAFCSPLKHPRLEEEPRGSSAIATAAFKGCETFELKCMPPLLWYLLEESLEIQVWVAFGKHKRPRPHDTDRLVGSAYVDLSVLARRGQHKLTITGVYPLFKRSAPNLSGAAVRVHIAMTHNVGTSLPREPDAGLETEGEHSSSGEEEAEQEDHPLAVTPGTPSSLQRRTSTGSEIPPSQKPELDAENTFAVSIIVERAMHLSLKGSTLAEHSGAVPCCCVSYSTAEASSPITTSVVQDSDCPVWDHQQESRLTKQLLMDPQQTLVFKVWHKGVVERVIGFASVDLSPLLAGFQSVCGWYNITDFNGQCQGQLKVSISPLESIQYLRAQRKAAEEEGGKDAIPSPMYHTTAMYSSFPTHISRYPEQRIISSPDQQEAIFSERSSVVDRHEEHMSGVRMYHQSLSEGQVLSHGCIAGETHPSSSTLFSALRKNLNELDDIQRYFSHKLCAPVASSLQVEDQRSQLEGQREPQVDAHQLLLKSNFLREVSPFTDLEGNHVQSSNDVFSDPFSSEEQSLLSAEAKTTHVLSIQAFTEDLKDRVSPPPSSVPENDDINSDMFTPEEANEYEGEGEGCHNEDVEEEDSDEEEYEESVIEPRTLNEFTSLTEKTSPWTSALSDPDFASLQSLEESEEKPAKDCPQDEPCGPSSEEALELDYPHAGQKDSQCTEPNEERALHLLAEEASKSVSVSLLDQPLGNEMTADKAVLGQDEDSEEDSPRLHLSKDVLDMTDHHSEIACSPTDDNETQLLSPVEIPNFFLPAHHMEASMRALRLAPVFPAAYPETAQRPDQPGIPFRRTPRSRPNLFSTNKEETKRIAKIFASRFSDDK